MITNHIQVFGLHRSGTNFLEWSLQNNFVDLNYIRYTEYDRLIKGDYKGLTKYNEYNSLKHTTPNLKHSPYIIAIYKPLNEWLTSITKSNHLVNKKEAIESYYKWKDDINKVPNGYKILTSHKVWVEDYYNLMELISLKFKAKLKPDINFPNYKLGKDINLTSQPFKLKY